MQSDKMTDEKLERAVDGDGVGDGQQVDARRVLRRLDVRFVLLLSSPLLSSPLFSSLPEFCFVPTRLVSS
jgi:hypothetical protein